MGNNLIQVDFEQFTNNRLTIPGMYAEYTAADWAEMAKAEVGDGDSTAAQRLFYDEAAKAVILRPHIMPIDMVIVPSVIAGVPDRGDWWDIAGAGIDWEMIYPEGEPRRQMIFQRAVQDADLKAVSWRVFAGEGRGIHQVEGFGENQGVVFWFDGLKLPENEENELEIQLYRQDEQGNLNNAIKVQLKGSQEARLGYLIDVPASAADTTFPPQTQRFTQWVSGAPGSGQQLVDWTADATIYVLRILDGKIYFSINGLEQPLVLEAEHFDEGETAEGLKYPVILRAGANLFIKGKGQCMFGFKKLSYEGEGGLSSAVFAPGYSPVADQSVRVTRAMPGDVIQSRWEKRGVSDQTQMRARVWMEGAPLEIGKRIPADEVETRLRDYREAVSETTPLFRKIKTWDKQVRIGADLTLPDNISGDADKWLERVSCGDNRVMTAYDLEIECIGTFDKPWGEMAGRRKVLGDPKIVFPVEEGSPEVFSAGKFVFTKPRLSRQGFENISLHLSGEDAVLHVLHQGAGLIISYDDREITDLAAMGEIAEMAGVAFSTNITEGRRLPESVEGEEGAWTFQPNTTFYEILEKLATVQGYYLYTHEGILNYNEPPAEGSDFEIGDTAGYPTEGIEVQQEYLYRSPIYVIGRAGENTREYKRGDKLVGVWKSQSLEDEVGYTPLTITDPTLTDWTQVQRAGDQAWRKHNERTYRLSFNMVDAREYWNDIKPFAVFTWKSELYPAIHNQRFLVVGYSRTADGFGAQASIEAEMI